jgi:hypothetical protein
MKMIVAFSSVMLWYLAFCFVTRIYLIIRYVLHHELAEIYGRQHEYPARVQRLLRASYELHIQETVTKLSDWLECYKGTFAITWSPD